MLRALAIGWGSLILGCGQPWPRGALELVPCWPLCAQGDGGYDIDTRGDAGETGGLTWGQYTANLTLPSCPAGAVLVVNTATDEIPSDLTLTTLAQAGPTLSFTEAAWLAFNRPGPNTITFDPAVFPPESPQVITLHRRGIILPDSLSATCIDGRGRGVILDWADPNSPRCTRCQPSLLHGSLWVGLTLRGLTEAFTLENSQIAGCWLSGEGAEVINARANAFVGPENVFDADLGVRTDFSTGVVVRGNSFGFDPVRQRPLRTRHAVTIFAPLVFEYNVVWSTEGAFGGAMNLFDPATVIRENFFGIDRSRTRVQQPTAGLAVMLTSGRFNFGPGNIVRGWVEVGPTYLVRAVITRSEIFGDDQGIVFEGAAPFEAPTITSASETLIEGTCPLEGLVELYSQLGSQRGPFVGDGVCSTNAPWQLSVYVPRGRNVVATLTVVGRTSAYSAPRWVP